MSSEEKTADGRSGYQNEKERPHFLRPPSVYKKCETLYRCGDVELSLLDAPEPVAPPDDEPPDDEPLVPLPL